MLVPVCRRARPRAGFALAAALAAALPAPSAVHAEGPPLSLAEAVRLAGERAPAIAAQRAALRAAEAEVLPAGQRPDPELVLALDNLPIDGPDAFQPNPDFMTMRRVGLMQALPRREKLELRTDRARAIAEREGVLLGVARLGVAESVAKAWIERYGAEQRLALLEAFDQRSAALQALSAAAVVDGRAGAADAIATTAAVVRLADRVADAQRELDEARAEFDGWLPGLAGHALAAPPDFAVLPIEPERLLAGLVRHRELAAYAAAERVAADEVALARAEKRPDWSVELAYQDRGPRYSNMVSVALRVPLPLFAASRQDPKIAAREAGLQQAVANRAEAERMHATQLRKTVAAWRSALDRDRRYRDELLPLADARIDAALAALRGGRGPLAAAVAALDDAVEQRIAASEVRTRLGRAWAELAYAYSEEH